jgi:hypothetical protein
MSFKPTEVLRIPIVRTRPLKLSPRTVPKKLLMLRLPKSQTKDGLPLTIPALPVMSLIQSQAMLIERREWRCEIGCVCHWVMYHTVQKNVSLICLVLLIFI